MIWYHDLLLALALFYGGVYSYTMKNFLVVCIFVLGAAFAQDDAPVFTSTQQEPNAVQEHQEFYPYFQPYITSQASFFALVLPSAHIGAGVDMRLHPNHALGVRGQLGVLSMVVALVGVVSFDGVYRYYTPAGDNYYITGGVRALLPWGIEDNTDISTVWVGNASIGYEVSEHVPMFFEVGVSTFLHYGDGFAASPYISVGGNYRF